MRPLLAALVAVVVAACATAPEPRPAVEPAIVGRVAIVAAPSVPEINFSGFARNHAQGVFRGFGATFVACTQPAAHGGCSGEMCGAVMILFVGVCTGVSAVGGMVGGLIAPGSGTVHAATAQMITATQPAAIHQTLRDRVVEEAGRAGHALPSLASGEIPVTDGWRDYRPLSGHLDTVLEVGLDEVGTRGNGINPPIQLYMVARARLVSTVDNSIVFQSEYSWAGESWRLAEWSAGEADRLAENLRTGYAALAAEIYENLFLRYPVPARQGESVGIVARAFGLAPLEPPTRGLLGGNIAPAHTDWIEVASPTPTLRWQAFPRTQDIAVEPAAMARVTNVRYDLLIAAARGMAPGDVVYRREGLVEPAHTVEAPLQPDTRYFWTVRARFAIDGRERATEWGYIAARPLELSPLSAESYRFKTP